MNAARHRDARFFRSGFSCELFPSDRGAAGKKLAAKAAPTKNAFTRAVAARQRGYTLIEVIVAFAVLALALTLLLGSLTGAARQIRQSADAGRAALHAQSLLAQTGVGEPLRPGRKQGEFESGRYKWTLEVAPYNDPTQPPGTAVDPNVAQLLQLRLPGEWGGAPPGRVAMQ